MFKQLLARLGRALDTAGIPYMLIGGQAVLLHGEPRATADIDVTVGVDVSQLARLLAVARELSAEVLPNPPEQFVTQMNVLRARDFSALEEKRGLAGQLEQLLAEFPHA